MDFAYIANGYVYHTPLDVASRIDTGAVQRLGDNLVGTIRELVDVKGNCDGVIIINVLCS